MPIEDFVKSSDVFLSIENSTYKHKVVCVFRKNPREGPNLSTLTLRFCTRRKSYKLPEC